MVRWLGRSERLSGTGGLMIINSDAIRHATTFVLVEKMPSPQHLLVEAQVLPEGVVQPRTRKPSYRIRGKTPTDMAHLHFCATH